jgi:Crp-like helix-turn-helix domain
LANDRHVGRGESLYPTGGEFTPLYTVLAARGYSPTHLILRMTRDEIASYLGLRGETVCRIFAKFRDERLISVPVGLSPAYLSLGLTQLPRVVKFSILPSRPAPAATIPIRK